MVYSFLYVTAADEEEAKNISKLLLEKKLIACANIFPIKSMYWWKGKITEESEVVLILKTLMEKVAAVKSEIEKIHSYKITCITEIKVEPNEKYGRWLKEQIE